MGSITYNPGNDKAVRVKSLYDVENAAYVNDATVTLSIFNKATNTIVGSPYSFSYEVGSNGDYLLILPDDIAVVVGDIYYYELSVTAGTFNAKTKCPFVVSSLCNG